MQGTIPVVTNTEAILIGICTHYTAVFYFKTVNHMSYILCVVLCKRHRKKKYVMARLKEIRGNNFPSESFKNKMP